MSFFSAVLCCLEPKTVGATVPFINLENIFGGSLQKRLLAVLPVCPGICCSAKQLRPNFRAEISWRKRESCLLLLNVFNMTKDIEDIIWGLAVNACSSAVTKMRKAMYLLWKKTQTQ